MTLQPPADDPPPTVPPILISNSPRVPPPARWRSALVAHNPCFLLSAVSMFIGCYLINTALDVRTGDVAKLFALLGAINLYEISLLVLGLLLLRRARWNRDGIFLLLIQMLFLADGPFLLAETAMATARWAPAVNALLLLLAAAKATIAMRGLGIRLRSRSIGFLLLQLVLIYVAFPRFFSHVAVDGVIGAAPMYLAWWIVGMLPALYELLSVLDPLPLDADAPLFVRRAYLIVPWLLLVAHLGFFQWAYRAPFFAGDLAPLFIGLAIATIRLKPSTFLKRSDLQLLRILLPAVAAILACVGGEVDLHWVAGSAFVLHPIAMTFAVMFLVYAYFFSGRAAALVALLLAATELLHLAGITCSLIGTTFTRLAKEIYTGVIWIMPSSAIAWGILSILAAFALLGVGGILTLRRTSPKPVSS